MILQDNMTASTCKCWPDRCFDIHSRLASRDLQT